ncbi:AAA family ATPase, partial [Candidatus Gribaldobacteria bacterium]|nr:AAA family ATPase [Candidatus Gribaldobacteria bacterium]
MFYPRKIYPQLKEHLPKKQVSVITGMRRVGKTTLLKQLLSEIPSKNKAYFDLERVDIRDLFSEKNYDAIVATLQSRGLNTKQKLYLALDEIQLSPGIASTIKYLYDNYKIKFIVSGSSSFYLKNLFSESLAGRKKIFELFPLDFGEFLNFKNRSQKQNNPDVFKGNFQKSEYQRLRSFYDDFINFGGFPEVVLSKTIDEKKDL